MTHNTSFETIRNILIAVYLVFVLALAAWCLQGYHAAKQALATLEGQKTLLARLNTEIENTHRSVNSLKAEQEEFKQLLFSDRDVPAFLDSLSRSAAKDGVHIIDMKTQRFSQLTVPKDLAAASSGERLRAYEEDDQPKKDPKVEFKNMLTLAAMPIHIKIQGKFGAIVHFLSSVESERQLLTVSNVEIDRNTDYPQLSCDFILKIYSLELLKDIKT